MSENIKYLGIYLTKICNRFTEKLSKVLNDSFENI